MEQLLFAQRFPFSKAAKGIIAGENLSLEALPELVIERAEIMARHALSGKKYSFDLRSTDLLLQELLAFPVAKILVSFTANPVLYKRLASLVADSAYSFLKNSKDKGKIAVSLATDLGLSFDFPQNKAFFVSLPLNEFLSVPLNDDSLKLVNQFASKGLVFLDINGFSRFLREKSYSLVLSSLPVPVEGIPKNLKSLGQNLKLASKQREQKLFKEAFKGRVAPDAFPPCIAQMYGQLASGQKLAHMANFTLATFLNNIGMPQPQILALFKKSPNFKERIAGYQLDRIAKQNYTPPSCEKIRGYALCPDPNCKRRHPLSHYRWHLRKNQKQKPQQTESQANKESQQQK